MQVDTREQVAALEVRVDVVSKRNLAAIRNRLDPGVLFMEGHEKDDERECGKRHHGDRHVAVFHEVDEFAAYAGRGAGEERTAAELEPGMVSAHDKSGARKGERAISHEISVLPHVFFFSREHGDDEYHRVGIEESAFDPAEHAGPEVGEFGIEQTSDDAADGNDERKENGIASEECADALAPAAVTERRREEHKKKDGENIREDREEGKKIGDVLDDGGHGVLVGRAQPVFSESVSSVWTPVAVNRPGIARSDIPGSYYRCRPAFVPKRPAANIRHTGRYCAESPNSFFWSWQWGHQNAPKNVVLVFAMHFAKASYFPFGGGMVFM